MILETIYSEIFITAFHRCLIKIYLLHMFSINSTIIITFVTEAMTEMRMLSSRGFTRRVIMWVLEIIRSSNKVPCLSHHPSLNERDNSFSTSSLISVDMVMRELEKGLFFTCFTSENVLSCDFFSLYYSGLWEV